MVLRTIETLADTITSEAAPSTSYAARPTLTVRNQTDRRLLAYIIVRGLPLRDGAIVNSAVLRLYASASFSSITVSVRQPTSAWSTNVRWNNQPAGGSIFASTTAAAGLRAPFDIDVSTAVQHWLDGGGNRGMRLETTFAGAGGISWYSVNASGTNAPFKPVLLLDVSYPPETPTALAPADGAAVSSGDPLATWRYGGELVEPMVAYQLQTSLSDGGWDTPLFDSGEVTATVPQHQFSGVSGTIFWRVRHKSADGRWSAWSSAASFTVTAKMTVTITSTETVSDDPTPTTTWTVSGSQTAFQVLLRREDTGVVLADSGVLAGDDSSWAPAQALSVDSSVGIMREVRVWDDVDRVATPGDPVYAVAVNGPFTIEPASSVDPVTNLTVSLPIGPAVDVQWSRGTTPDEFIIERRIGADGAWVRFLVESGDVAVGGGDFLWRDVTAPALRVLSYRVRPVHNGAMGEAPLEVSTTLRPGLIWLADPDDPDWLLPVAGNDEISWEYAEQSSVLDVAEGGGRVLVHEGFGGAGGTVTGHGIGGLVHTGLSIEEIEDRFWDLKRKPGHIWRLIVQARNIPVWVRAAQLVPQPGAEETYGVSFEFGQWGELPWDEQAA